MADCTRRRGAARRGAAAVRRANGERARCGVSERCTRMHGTCAGHVVRGMHGVWRHRGRDAPLRRRGRSRFRGREGPGAGSSASVRRSGVRGGAVRRGRAPFGAADQGCERREGHDQQREVGDELELLRGVAVRRVAGRTRIGVRVDVEEAVDAVDVGEERHAAPVPGKEYQKQQGAYVFQSFTHRTDGLGAKICFFCETERRAAPFRRPGRIFFRIRHFARAKRAASAAEVNPHFSEYSGAGGEPAGGTAGRAETGRKVRMGAAETERNPQRAAGAGPGENGRPQTESRQAGQRSGRDEALRRQAAAGGAYQRTASAG